jgi:hypothetical protein
MLMQTPWFSAMNSAQKYSSFALAGQQFFPPLAEARGLQNLIVYDQD